MHLEKGFVIKSIFFLISFTSLLAEWSPEVSSPQLIGNGIQPQVGATSDGGVYIAWITDGNYHVYIQKMDELGIPQFGESGLLISDNQNASWIAVYHLNIVVDSEDNAILSTVDQRTGTWEVYMWKISPTGSMLWDSDGLAITNSSTSNMSPRLTLLEDNSIIVTCGHNDGDILFQKISSDGDLLWGEGIVKQDNSRYLVSPQSIVDDNGHIIFQWLRQSSGWPIYSEIFIQKYDINGDSIWAEPVLIVGPTSFPMGNFLQEIHSAPSGGSYIAWTELSGNVQNAIVESIANDGSPLWNGGLDLSENSSHFRISPSLEISENSAQIMAVWKETNGSQSQRGITAQRLDSTGTRLWGSNGTPVVDMNSNYDYLDISISKFDEDLIITYLEQSPNMVGDIYSKRLDSLGNMIWENDAIIVTNSNTQKSDVNAKDGVNCIFISWSENGSIFAHCLRSDGSLGPPDIINPINCDSGYVEIDGFCFYENDIAVLQNLIDNSYASGIDLGCEDYDPYCGSPNPYMDDPDSWFWKTIDGQEYNFADGDSIVEPLELGLQTWENGRLKSMMCGAYIYCQLSGDIPDSIYELTEIEQLRLEFNYLSGNVPESICELNIEYEDYLSFDLTGNLLCPPYPSCIQDHIGSQDTANCEEVAIISEIAPDGYFLDDAYPNPFNPITNIGYYLPKNMMIEITIYDILGNIITKIVKQSEGPGHSFIQWDANNDQGYPVSAGVYFFNIVAGNFSKTKKMLLLK